MVLALRNHMRKAGAEMNFNKKVNDERGQGLVESTFSVLLVVLVLWLGVKGTNASDSLVEQNHRLCQ